MPSIHAILLVALGGVLGADPQDYSAPQTLPVEDPFEGPTGYYSGGGQPNAPANRAATPAVRLPPGPSPDEDSGAPDAYLPNSYAQTASPIGVVEPSEGADPNQVHGTLGYTAAPQPWSAAPDNAAPQTLSAAQQTMGVEQGQVLQRPADAPRRISPPAAGNQELLPHMLPTVAWPVVIGSLSVVIGLFLLMVWVMRRGSPRAGGPLPREVVEVLGRAPLADHKQIQLLRLGNKLVLVAISSAGADALAEITDPVEVDRLTGLCYQRHPHSSTVAFEKVFKSMETTPRRRAARGAAPVSFADLERLGFDDQAAETDNVH